MTGQVDQRRLADFVNQLLFETPGGFRFTQDSPVLTNVWLEYAKAPRSQQKLILTISREKSTGEAAHELREMIGNLRRREAEGKYRLPTPWIEGRRRARISYIPGQISAELYFDEMMRTVLPLTPWWRDAYTTLRRLETTGKGGDQDARVADWQGFPMHSEGRIQDTVDGLMMMRREILEEQGAAGARRKDLSAGRRKYLHQIPISYLWLVRIAGLIGNAFLNGHGLLDDDDRLGGALARDFSTRRRSHAGSGEPAGDDVARTGAQDIAQNRRQISEAFSSIYQNWSEDFCQPSQNYIWRVTKNRPVELAVSKSALTVKADAARRLFDVSCKDISWAVIDSGIDSDHPAFRNTTDAHERAKRDGAEELHVDQLDTRVIKTLDFTHLRELLDYDVLDPSIEETKTERAKLLKDLRKRLLVRHLPDPRDCNLDTDEKVEIANRQANAVARRQVKEHLARLKDRIETKRDIDWQDLEPLIVDRNPDRPRNDHGTHVAGILGADWIEEGHEDLPLKLRPRRMQGICPDIKLIDVRVFREDGKTDEFELLAAVQFLRWMNSRAGYMVVHGANLSLSLVHEVRRFACGQTPICEECNEASALGMVIVAAAGNRGFEATDMNLLSHSDGFRDATITDPGNAEHVITVGATHRKRPYEYGVSYFSSRGPTGDGRLKPDLVAPGEKIKGPTPDGAEEYKDGTSMAAPHVSGGAAMLMARHPELVGEPARIKRILCETATDLNRERYYQGCGLLDILRALQSV